MLVAAALQPLDELPGRLRHEVVVEDEPRPVLALHPAHVVAAVGRSPFVCDDGKELVMPLEVLVQIIVLRELKIVDKIKVVLIL